MKVVIAGSRNFNDLKTLTRVCNHYLKNQKTIEVVSGTAKGADRLGEAYAYSKGYKLTRFPADWDSHGQGAGIIRNREMAEYADAVIVFWDGHSRGTANMIKVAGEFNLRTKIYKYDREFN